MRIRRFPPGQSLAWIACGWRIAMRNIFFWIVVSVLYTLLALAMSHVPILGGFALVVVTVVALSNAVLVIDGLARQRRTKAAAPAEKHGKSSLRSGISAAFAAPSAILRRSLGEVDNILAMLQLSVFALAIVLVGQMIVSFIAGSVVLETVQAEQMSALQNARSVFAILTGLLFYVLLATFMIYAVPLSLLDDLTVLGAIFFGCRAALQNPIPCLVFLVLLLMPLSLLVLAFLSSPTTGAVVSLLVGGFVLPVAVNSMFCNYKLTYERE